MDRGRLAVSARSLRLRRGRPVVQILRTSGAGGTPALRVYGSTPGRLKGRFQVLQQSLTAFAAGLTFLHPKPDEVIIPGADGEVEACGNEGASVAEVLDIDDLEIRGGILPVVEIDRLIDPDGHDIDPGSAELGSHGFQLDQLGDAMSSTEAEEEHE